MACAPVSQWGNAIEIADINRTDHVLHQTPPIFIFAEILVVFKQYLQIMAAMAGIDPIEKNRIFPLDKALSAGDGNFSLKLTYAPRKKQPPMSNCLFFPGWRRP